ncbi:MAG: 3-isopropylmalate dehydrogenase [Alphaproteobacteria bacterium]|nr:3-isopropylmalate dehydrogenase [Alphaproteobacteria bacterium]
MVMSKHIVLLPGDGIGPEVMAEAVKVIKALELDITFEEKLVGGAAIDATGSPLPADTLEACKHADACLLACVGGPKWAGAAYDKRPEAGLLGLRKEMDLYANLRPAIVFDALIDASTLKPEIVRGLDILIVRELTGGVYFGQPRGITDIGNGERRGVNTQVYTTSEIRRVAAKAFELARARGGKVCSVEKSNVMESGLLWREEVTKLHAEQYTDVQLSHMYADNCAMQLLRTPSQFDVIVTDNLFGDILSDEAAMLTGSLGMLPSASLGAGRASLYEPVHGSAPDIAGQNKANPLAMILSLAMAMRYSLGAPEAADRIESAVKKTLADGVRTADIGPNPVSTAAMGDAVVARL